MSAAVWKFTLSLADWQGIEMPDGAEILHVADQYGALCMWARVEPDAPLAVRRFTVVGTGDIPPVGGIHRGTALMHGGSIVWHVFEVIA